MPDLQPRQVLLICLSLPLLAALALWFYLLAPLVSDWSQARALHQLMQSSVTTTVTLEPRIIELERELVQLHRDLYGRMDQLPAQELQARIMGELQQLSWQHHVRLGGILPREGEQLNIFRGFQFDIDMEADYGQLVAWVDHLSDSIGFAVVDRFSMQPVAGGNNAGQQSPDIRMQVTVASWRPVAENRGEQP